MTRAGDGDDVGYGRPPASSQFKKGVSGNPRGRPKKARPPEPEPLHPANYPTRQLLRTESARMISVRDGDGTAEIPTTQAVIRSLAIQAAKVGPFAQRTWMHITMQEDERYRREKQENFEFWRGYVADQQDKIDDAARRGEPPYEPVPHPEDIRLNYHTFEVEFVGPLDAKEKARQDQTVALRDHFRAMSVYSGEFDIRARPPTSGALGLYTLLSTLADFALPPRIRSGADYESKMWRLINTNREELGAQLAVLSSRSNLPFVPERTSRPLWIPEEQISAWMSGKFKPDISTATKPDGR